MKTEMLSEDYVLHEDSVGKTHCPVEVLRDRLASLALCGKEVLKIQSKHYCVDFCEEFRVYERYFLLQILNPAVGFFQAEFYAKKRCWLYKNEGIYGRRIHEFLCFRFSCVLLYLFRLFSLYARFPNCCFSDHLAIRKW